MSTCVNSIYYQRNREKRLAYAHSYYHNNKEKLKRKRNNLPKEKKDKILNYQKSWRDNRSEEKIIKSREHAREYARNRYHTVIKPLLDKNKLL